MNGSVPVGGPAWARWLALAPIAFFSIAAQHDYSAHAALRWQAAQGLVAQGVAPTHIKAGFEWDGWYGFEEGARYIHATNDLTHIDYPPDVVMDNTYQISDLPLDGYSGTGSLTYSSWLEPGLTHPVLMLKRK